MPRTSHREEIDIAAADLWAAMIDKIEHPDRYVPGVTKVEILGRGDEGTERRMTLDNGKVVHEMISASPATMTVIFKLLDDPDHFGTIRNTVFEVGDRVVLEYALDWTRRDDGETLEAQRQALDDMIAVAVRHAKELMTRSDVGGVS